jgi:hypothetical protein
MIGINLEFEKNVPFPLGKPILKDRPATAKDLICLWVEKEGEVGDSFKIQGYKLKTNVCGHFVYKTSEKGYRFRLSYRTLDKDKEIYRVWITEKYRVDKLPDGEWDYRGTWHEHKRIKTSNWEDEIL